MTDEDLEESPDGGDDSSAEGLYEHFALVVDKGQEMVRIDRFLTDRMRNASRNRIQNAARAGCILVNDAPVKPNYRVKPHDRISVVMPHPPYDNTVIPQDIPLDIVYEDPDLMVINKPPGLVVHPGHGNYSGTLVNGLLHYLQHLPDQGRPEADGPRPGLVHRLDKDTSGIMVIAKTELAMSHLAKQFFDRTTDRLYTAIVWGDVKEDTGTITGHIGRSLKNRMQMDVFPGGEYGRHAVTHFRVLERFGYITLLECKLETGRTHQIRAHLRHIGHTLFNDARYGGDEILKGTTFTKYKQFIQNCFAMMPRHGLHARTLSFTQPTTGQRLSFDSDLPADMMGVVQKWRTYTAAKGRGEEDAAEDAEAE